MTKRTTYYALACSPRASKKQLEDLVTTWPAQVLANVVTPLLLLEDPGWWVVPKARRLLAVRRFKARHHVSASIAMGYGERKGYIGPGYGDFGNGCGAGDTQEPDFRPSHGEGEGDREYGDPGNRSGGGFINSVLGAGDGGTHVATDIRGAGCGDCREGNGHGMGTSIDRGY